MKLIDETTGLACHLFRSAPYTDRLLGWVVAKATYDVDASGAVTRDEAKPEAIRFEAEESAFGELPAENVLRKEGLDVYALAYAHAPGGRATRMEVRVRIGELDERILVVGNRRWEKGIAKLTPSDPEPFERMPLTWERAFGGHALLQNKPIPFPDNPIGCGYILEKGCAPDTPLPNIEDPARPITNWKDQPTPVGIAPLAAWSKLRVDGSVDVDEKSGEPRVKPSFYNCAPPRLRLPRFPAGGRVTVDGLTADGEWSFTLPELRLETEVSLEDRRHRIPAVADTICLLPEERRFVVTYRSTFFYNYVPEEIRVARFRFLD